MGKLNDNREVLVVLTRILKYYWEYENPLSKGLNTYPSSHPVLEFFKILRGKEWKKVNKVLPKDLGFICGHCEDVFNYNRLQSYVLNYYLRPTPRFNGFFRYCQHIDKSPLELIDIIEEITKENGVYYKKYQPGFWKTTWEKIKGFFGTEFNIINFGPFLVEFILRFVLYWLLTINIILAIVNLTH